MTFLRRLWRRWTRRRELRWPVRVGVDFARTGQDLSSIAIMRRRPNGICELLFCQQWKPGVGGDAIRSAARFLRDMGYTQDEAERMVVLALPPNVFWPGPGAQKVRP